MEVAHQRIVEATEALSLISPSKSEGLPGRRNARTALEVWVVEDREEIRELTVQLLNDQADIHCSQSFESAEAMLSALSQEAPPRLILSDINLPGLSGIESIREVRGLAPRTPVLIMTTFWDVAYEAEAREAGAAGFVTKTCETAQLVNLIRLACSNPPAASRPAEKVAEPRPQGWLAALSSFEAIWFSCIMRSFEVFRALRGGG